MPRVTENALPDLQRIVSSACRRMLMAYFTFDTNLITRLLHQLSLEDSDMAAFVDNPVYGFYRYFLDGTDERFCLAINEMSGESIAENTKEAMACELCEKAVLRASSMDADWVRFLLAEVQCELEAELLSRQ